MENRVLGRRVGRRIRRSRGRAWMWLAPALCAAGLAVAPAGAEDDGPVSVPFEDMTDEEWEAREARRAAYERAEQAWRAHDQQVCAANAEHEARLAAWRVAIEAWNRDPSLPDPGSRPELVLPGPPPMPRPAAMEPLACSN